MKLSTQRDFEDLQERVEEFIERDRNESRLRSELGYCSPGTFEKDSELEAEGASFGPVTALNITTPRPPAARKEAAPQSTVTRAPPLF